MNIIYVYLLIIVHRDGRITEKIINYKIHDLITYYYQLQIKNAKI